MFYSMFLFSATTTRPSDSEDNYINIDGLDKAEVLQKLIENAQICQLPSYSLKIPTKELCDDYLKESDTIGSLGSGYIKLGLRFNSKENTVYVGKYNTYNRYNAQQIIADLRKKKNNFAKLHN